MSAETYEEFWGRLRDRLRSSPAPDPDPLSGLMLVGERKVSIDRGRRREPDMVTLEVFVDKKTMRPRAYRYPDGTLERVSESTQRDTHGPSFTVRRRDPDSSGREQTVVQVGEVTPQRLELAETLGLDTRWARRLMRRGR